ncbi:MAG: hypothetical protein IPM38_12285 [Ignavibacteria bacterium]|nr:hypothetical protein [Ignavibacteria bacterium]
MLNRKNIFLSIAAISVFSLTIFSCSEDIVSPPPAPVDSTQFKYPFTNGSRWTYHKVESATNIRPDSIVQYFTDFPRITDGSVTILYDTVINSVVTKCFLDEFTIANNTYQNRYYYINNDTALILFHNVLTFSSGGFLPLGKIKFNTALADKNVILNSEVSDLYSVFDSIDIALKYPFVTGLEWSTFVNNVGSYYKYMGFENLANPMGGVISCMRVYAIKSYLQAYPIYLFYSKYGLMEKYQNLNDLTVSSVTHPEGIGFVDIEIKSVVTSFQIAE